jgi:hypothetical protein
VYKPRQKLECIVLFQKSPGQYFVRLKENGSSAILCDTQPMEPGEEVYGLFVGERDGRSILAPTSHRGTERVSKTDNES